MAKHFLEINNYSCDIELRSQTGTLSIADCLAKNKDIFCSENTGHVIRGGLRAQNILVIMASINTTYVEALQLPKLRHIIRLGKTNRKIFEYMIPHSPA